MHVVGKFSTRMQVHVHVGIVCTHMNIDVHVFQAVSMSSCTQHNAPVSRSCICCVVMGIN